MASLTHVMFLLLYSYQHGLDTLHDLSELSRYVTSIDLNANEVLPWEDETHHGLFFIEYGQLRIEHNNSDPYTTTTLNNRTFPATRGNHPAAAASAAAASASAVLTIGHLNARSAGALLKAAPHVTTTTSIRGLGDLTEQNFRLARVGPGWVVGMIEECSGLRRSGVYVSVNCCRLHHLPYESMKEIESSDPRLMMNLYKLMSSVSLKRQEMTIGQLAQFVSIMNSPTAKY